ncbi:hypothetical protein C480_05926 [Natrialba aegyptia DSM 13077]|uniref:Uncharacterized protein n=1 Tax=Natrialba aegyptia DSM 13077 TaxID=1227491 RepID=M0BD68_9EURY|nr:hypothetical protein C480_05926 [Natrialba aegyptia DSM 13077]
MHGVGLGGVVFVVLERFVDALFVDEHLVANVEGVLARGIRVGDTYVDHRVFFSLGSRERYDSDATGRNPNSIE